MRVFSKKQKVCRIVTACSLFLPSTFVCPTEIVAFSNKANEFRDVNCEVVAVSVDSHFCHLAWINTPRKVWIGRLSGVFFAGLLSFHRRS